MPLAKKDKKVKGVSKYKIDLTNPIDDGIIDIKKFEAFLKDKVKVGHSRIKKLRKTTAKLV